MSPLLDVHKYSNIQRRTHSDGHAHTVRRDFLLCQYALRQLFAVRAREPARESGTVNEDKGCSVGHVLQPCVLDTRCPSWVFRVA